MIDANSNLFEVTTLANQTATRKQLNVQAVGNFNDTTRVGATTSLFRHKHKTLALRALEMHEDKQ